MAISIKVLGSSSSGNCGLLICSGHYYLIDAGFSGKKIKEKLATYGLTLEDLEGLFLTHEHQDHCCGLKVLSKHKNIKFYANYRTAEAVEKRYHLEGQWSIFESNKPFNVHDLEVLGFRTSHDAIEPVGFLFKTSTQCCCWATDIGCITPEMANVLIKADDLILEANHDLDLLWHHPTRPQYLKERIASDTGHLSNGAAFQFVKNSPHHLKSLCLAHISKDCNSIDIVKRLFQPLAMEQHFDLEIVDPVLE